MKLGVQRTSRIVYRDVLGKSEVLNAGKYLQKKLQVKRQEYFEGYKQNFLVSSDITSQYNKQRYFRPKEAKHRYRKNITQTEWNLYWKRN